MTDAPNRYPMACALAAWAMTPPDVSDDELLGILASASDVPEDRLAFCFSEMKQALEPTRAMVAMVVALTGAPQTARMIEEMLGDSAWIDDSKGDATYAFKGQDPETGEIWADASLKTKLGKA